MTYLGQKAACCPTWRLQDVYLVPYGSSHSVEIWGLTDLVGGRWLWWSSGDRDEIASTARSVKSARVLTSGPCLCRYFHNLQRAHSVQQPMIVQDGLQMVSAS